MYRDRYSSNPSPLDAWLRTGAPLTVAIIAINFLTMALTAFRVPVAEYFALVIPQALVRPWTLLTYPFVSTDVIGMIFYGLALFFIGGSLERSWGSRFYALYFLAMTIITALGLTLGAFLLRAPVAVSNWMPIAALLLAWCLLNPNEEVRFYFFIPIKARFLALIEVVIIFFTYTQFHPLMGFFALSGCAASFAWVYYRPWSEMGHYTTRRQPRSRVVRPGDRPKDDRFTLKDLNPLERIARYRRRKQFERLMKDD
jgi:membrane associated rhomboid family serine protease